MIWPQARAPPRQQTQDVCAQIRSLETGAERAEPWPHGSPCSSSKGTCWHTLKVTKVSLQETKPARNCKWINRKNGEKTVSADKVRPARSVPIHALPMRMVEVNLCCFQTLLANVLPCSGMVLPAAEPPWRCSVSPPGESNILFVDSHTDRASREWPA